VLVEYGVLEDNAMRPPRKFLQAEGSPAQGLKTIGAHFPRGRFTARQFQRHRINSRSQAPFSLTTVKTELHALERAAYYRLTGVRDHIDID